MTTTPATGTRWTVQVPGQKRTAIFEVVGSSAIPEAWVGGRVNKSDPTGNFTGIRVICAEWVVGPA